MEVICKIPKSTYEICKDDDILIVESDYGKDVKLKFKDQCIVVNGEALKKAIDNCCNT